MNKVKVSLAVVCVCSMTGPVQDSHRLSVKTWTEEESDRAESTLSRYSVLIDYCVVYFERAEEFVIAFQICTILTVLHISYTPYLVSFSSFFRFSQCAGFLFEFIFMDILKPE